MDHNKINKMDYFKDNLNTLELLDTWYCSNDFENFIKRVNESKESCIIKLREDIATNSDQNLVSFLSEYYEDANNYFNEYLLTKSE